MLERKPVLNALLPRSEALFEYIFGHEALRGRCDSFVVETNVHYPTGINLLLDAMRKAVHLTARLCESHGLSQWRQHAYNVRHLKRSMRSAQNKKRSQAKTALSVTLRWR